MVRYVQRMNEKKVVFCLGYHPARDTRTNEWNSEMDLPPSFYERQRC